jgi:E3 ubiquitin-protein ligase UBR4
LIQKRYISEDSKMYVDQEAGKETATTTARVGVSTDDAISQMAMFLDKLASPFVRNNPKVTKTMTRIIPFLTYGNERYFFIYLY